MNDGGSDEAQAGHGELVARVESFIKGLERAHKSPSRGQTYSVVSALAFLQNGKFELGHSAMDKAERDSPLPPESSDVAEIDQDFTTAQLRGAFLDVMGTKSSVAGDP